MVRICEERVDSFCFGAFVLVFSGANDLAPRSVLYPFVETDVLWRFCWGCVDFEKVFESVDCSSVLKRLDACFCFKDVDGSGDVSSSDEA